MTQATGRLAEMQIGNFQIHRSVLILIVVVAAFLLWFAPGQVRQFEDEGEVTLVETEGGPRRMLVEVLEQPAREVSREIVLQGQTAHNRDVTVRAETGGTVREILVERGERVKTGQPVIRLSMDDRQARLRKVNALVAQHKNDYEAISELKGEGYLAESRMNEAFALLESARADLETIEQDIARTVLRAPFDGIVDEREVEIGDYVSVRDPVFVVVDDNPLVISANVPQQQVSALQKDSRASVGFITGHEATGRIRFISATADEATRTFNVEVEVPNSENALPAGVSAEVMIETGLVSAHLVSPGWLVRNASGAVGIFTLSPQDRIEFNEIGIVSNVQEGIWVTGLPELARIVSVGQGFVSEGQLVRGMSRERSDQATRLASPSSAPAELKVAGQ
jgi:multidrug efflux system membrane fusion protein